MNILYIGEAGEVGVKIVNLLSRTDKVTAVFPQKPEYETDCKVLFSDTDIETTICESKADAVVCMEDGNTSVKSLDRLLSGVVKSGCKLFYLREHSFFRRRKKETNAALNLCEYISRERGIDTVFISSSCLYSSDRIPRYLADTMRQIEKRNELDPGGAADEICDCMHIDDFCGALENIIHAERGERFEKIELQSAYPFTLSSFVENIKKRNEKVYIHPYTETAETSEQYDPYHSENWAPMHNFTDDLPLLLESLENRRRDQLKSARKKGLNIAVKLSVFAVLFVLTEVYTQYIAASSDLQYVDMRLLLVVVSAIFLGKHYGVIAAALCSIASIAQSIIAGTRWYVLFYHVDNWIPIAVYFVVAILLEMYLEKREKNDCR